MISECKNDLLKKKNVILITFDTFIVSSRSFQPYLVPFTVLNEPVLRAVLQT